MKKKMKEFNYDQVENYEKEKGFSEEMIKKWKEDKRFDTIEGLLEEVVYCLNQISNRRVESKWFKNTYEIINEIEKYL